jgi:outer membrane protein
MRSFSPSLLLTAAIVLLPAAPSLAQSSTPAQPAASPSTQLPSAATQDLVIAYRQAVKYDALVASAQSALLAARERVLQTRGGLLPAVNLNAGYSRQASESNLTNRREFDSKSFGVSLSYPLYRKQNVEVFEQSRLQIAVFEAQLEQARQDLMIRVAQAYFDVLAAQDNLGTIQAQKRAITEQLNSAKRNFEVGTATITDQQEAQARYDLNLAQEYGAENDLAVKRGALALLTGTPVATLNTLVKGIALTAPMPARESEWIATAREFNLGVMQANISTEVAKREIDRQRFGHYPTVDLVSNVGRSESASAQFIGVKANTASIGVQLNVPIYAGGAIDAREREAVLLHGKSLTDLEAARRNAEQAARASFLGVNGLLAQVRALEAAERSSQLALDSNLLGYQVGVRINIDVLNAQQQLFTTRRDLAKARYDVLVNGLKLKQVAGTLEEDDMSAVNNLLALAQEEKTEPLPAPRSDMEPPKALTPGSPALRGRSNTPTRPAAGGAVPPVRAQ